MKTFFFQDILRQTIEVARETGIWVELSPQERRDLIDCVFQQCCEQLLCGDPGAGCPARFEARGRIDVVSRSLHREHLAKKAA